MNFTEPSKVLDTLRAGDDVEFSRGANRVLINKAANNEPLMDEDEAERVGMKIYNRWGELMNALSSARRQYINNFMSSGTFFTIDLPKAPEEFRADWAGTITELLNDKLKEGDHALEYFELHCSRWGAVVCHGTGAVLWEDRYGWIPRYVAIEDFRVPTDTERSFRNLPWFGVRIAYTPGELSRKAFSKVQSKFKWDKDAVTALLRNVKECNTTMAENNYNWDVEPEKFEELRKQNAGYWSGDAMPTINLWHFYHEDENGKWRLKVVPDDTSTSGDVSEANENFVCQSEGAIADNWRQLTHVQFGDLNNKAPFMFHSVRSLGFAMFEPCYWTDFTRCRMLQHTLDQFNILLRVTDPVDKARAQIQVFQNLGVVKPGVSFIPNNERWQVDAGLVESVLAQTKQLQAEASTAYTQSIDNGNQREQTAFETGVKVQQNNAMLSGLMLTAFTYEKFFGKEICRRFCLQNSDDEDVKDFQQACKKAGIPDEWLDIKKWRVEPTSPLGNGNSTMAMVEAQNALQLRPMLDPSAQAEALHDAAVQMVGAKRAKRWVKMNPAVTSDAANAAANAFPLMMLGLPPQIPEGLNPIQQIQTLLGLCGGYIAKIEQTTKIPAPPELIGLKNVAAYITKLVTGMKGDTGNEALYKQFAHDLSQLNNEIKKLEMAMNQAMQKNGQGNGVPAETQAKIQAIAATTQAKLAGKQAETASKLKQKELADRQKMRHKDSAFVKEQQRKDVGTVAEIARTTAKTKTAKKPLEE
jgi:hypothetical protein